jgi:uridylate kinase
MIEDHRSGKLPTMDQKPADLAYDRVLLKISGEGFSSEDGFGIDSIEMEKVASELVEVAQTGVQLAVVVGGGNFLRGATFSEKGRIPRVTADYMGMLATVLNALALQETLEAVGQPTRVMSAFPISTVCEPFIRRKAIRHLERGRVIILAAGTGNPFVTTDTCAALRATEIAADVVLKATKVDGIYDKDPKKHDDAVKFDEVTFEQVLRDDLKVMDTAAFAMCREQRMPLVVFNVLEPGTILRVIRGEQVGTRIHP